MNIKAATVQYNMKEEEWLKNQEKRRINPRERERERELCASGNTGSLAFNSSGCCCHMMSVHIFKGSPSKSKGDDEDERNFELTRVPLFFFFHKMGGSWSSIGLYPRSPFARNCSTGFIEKKKKRVLAIIHLKRKKLTHKNQTGLNKKLYSSLI